MSVTRIGRYEIERELGRGAMAIVYKATDPVIGRVVAIKTIRLEHGTGMEQTELRQRLYREARSAGGLNHPNIVTIYDIGEEGEVSYIAMEFVEGQTLENWMTSHPIPPTENTISIVEQIASGLDYAAARGIIHRDIKPGNILLTSDLRAKIADFGIAKFSMAKMTQTGLVMGTPSYMSPEQAMGKDLDGRSDVFSLGIIFYEMLTGERPFTGTNPTTIIYKILHEQPVPPRKLNVTLHPGFDYIVRRMLEKNPDSRYQSCNEFIADLRNYRMIQDASAATAAQPVASPATAALPAAGPSGSPAGPNRTWIAGLTAAVALVAVMLLLYPRLREAWSPQAGPSATSPESIHVQPPPNPATGPKDPAPAPPEKAIEAALPKPKPPEAAPEKAAPAYVTLDNAPAYAVTVFDGTRRLDRLAQRPIEISAGEHRFRLVSEEVFLNRQLERIRLKPGETYSIPLPGLASAYIEVPNDAYEGCEILLNGRKIPTPYPAPLPKLAAGEHRLLFRWTSGRFAGKEVASPVSFQESGHYLIKGEPETGRVAVQRAR
jgi:serine/threonine-protein kinase